MPDIMLEVDEISLLCFFWVLVNLKELITKTKDKEFATLQSVTTRPCTHHQNHSHFKLQLEDWHNVQRLGSPLLSQSWTA
jgi:hypothetical protein